MSDTISAVKSNLGKLLASENIRIEHRQIQGPFFDVKERILALPIWKEMDSDLYDLMIGHEVGHALFTPADGWDASVKEYGMRFKQFLNIIEDVRIEKKMKRKYPGLRKPMYNGYTQLVDRGFFGVAMEEMKVLPFADRVNVYFKLGARSDISFNQTEQNFIDAVEAAETWEEVVTLSQELFNMAKAEKEELSEKIDEYLDDLEQTSSPSESAANEMESMQEASSEKKDMPNSLQELLNSDMKSVSQELQDQLREWSESDAPESITETSMKEKEKELIDENAYPYVYLKWPKTIDLSQWVIPAKITHDNLHFTDGMFSRRDHIYNNFMLSNKAYISYLVKKFEMRRNAKQFAKARVSNTGELDMKKVWKHKISEDVFLQSTIVPNGKNHGMLMMIDMSSSMQDNISGTIEQVISLAMFCKKVNIPFDVYGFIDNGYHHSDFSACGIVTNTTRSIGNKIGDLEIHNDSFRMKQLVCSSMRTSDFNNAIKNLLLLAHGFKHSYTYRYTDVRIPEEMGLSGTPLNEAIIVLKAIADKFKKDTRVEVLNTIILTDGDSSYGLSCICEGGYVQGINFWNGKIICEDTTSGVQQHIPKSDITGALLEMYKKMTGSNVIGFYLMSGRNYKSQILRKCFYGATAENANVDDSKFSQQYSTEFLKNNFFAVKMVGYSVYYMLAGEELELTQTNMSDILAKSPSTSSTKSTLLRAFKKMQNSKNVSRVFLNRFIQQIC